MSSYKTQSIRSVALVGHGAARALAQLFAKRCVLTLQRPCRCNEDLGTGRNAHGEKQRTADSYFCKFYHAAS